MLRPILTTLAVTLASITLAQPATDKPAHPGKPVDKKLTVGFSQVGAESAWRTAETKSIKDEAASRNVDLKFADAQGVESRQQMAVRSFITQGVDAIVIAPKVETGWEPVLKEAKAAHIPVFLVDRGVKVSDDSLYITLIASDFIQEGRMAADWLAKKTDGRCNIVELQGSTGSAPALDRKRGFGEAIKAHPDMKIIKTQSGDFNRAKGKEVMQSFIKAAGVGPGKIEALYAHNDDMALGAIQAIEEAGYKPGVDVVIVSIDSVKEAFEAMVVGKLNATVECNPLLGPILFDSIEKQRKGETLPKWVKQTDRLFEAKTAAEDLKSRQY